MYEINVEVKDFQDGICSKTWYIEQTENILNGIDSRTSESKESEKKWIEIKAKYQRDIKVPYIESLKPFDEDIEEEETENKTIKEFAYSDINIYFSDRVVKRIDKELRQIDINNRISKENEKTRLYYLFSFLFGKNENKDIVKKYRKEEKERIKRVRVFKEKELKKIKDRTSIKHYDYTVSTQKLHEDRNFGANHDTSKRKLKQIEVKKIQDKARKKAQKILRDLKKHNEPDKILKSLSIYITDIINDVEPFEVINVLHDLHEDVLHDNVIYKRTDDTQKTDTDKLIRYMDYSNRLESLRSYGISYKNLVNKDKRELKEFKKLEEEV